jgi:hypothetical protein
MEQREPTPRAKQALMDELREAVGDEAVERSDVDVDRAVREHSRRASPAEANRSRLMFVVIGAAGVIVAAAVALALESWVVLVVLLALHAIGTTIVVRTAFKATTDVEKPAPTTQALLEDEGVSDPEGALNDLVAQTDADAARQQESWSPGSAEGRRGS